MFLLGHLGIGSWIGARRVRAEQLGWLLLGTLLPDLIDKPLYYGLSLATGRYGPELGLISGTRTFGHTLLLVAVLWVVLPRRAGTPLALGMITHLALDELGDLLGIYFPALGTRSRPGTLYAILFPFLGLRFPTIPFRNVLEHLASLENIYVVAGEIAGAALLAWQWRAASSAGHRPGSQERAEVRQRLLEPLLEAYARLRASIGWARQMSGGRRRGSRSGRAGKRSALAIRKQPRSRPDFCRFKFARRGRAAGIRTGIERET